MQFDVNNEDEFGSNLVQVERGHKLGTESLPSEISSMEMAGMTVESETPSVDVAEIPPPELFSAYEAFKMRDGDPQAYDMRPHVFDGVTKKHLLLDSGSQVTAYPPDPGD